MSHPYHQKGYGSDASRTVVVGTTAIWSLVHMYKHGSLRQKNRRSYTMAKGVWTEYSSMVFRLGSECSVCFSRSALFSSLDQYASRDESKLILEIPLTGHLLLIAQYREAYNYSGAFVWFVAGCRQFLIGPHVCLFTPHGTRCIWYLFRPQPVKYHIRMLYLIKKSNSVYL